jgi:hypothetical protein
MAPHTGFWLSFCLRSPMENRGWRLMLVCSIAVLSSNCGKKTEKTERRSWTVTAGVQGREQLVERLRRSSISEQNEDESFILLVKNSPEFQISPAKEELDLIVVTAEELGLPIALWEPLIPFDEFKAKVMEAGYKLCPHDAVALLVLSIRGHEPLEFTYVAMERIMGMREKQPVMRPLVPVVFTYLGVTYIVMRPLDLVYEAPRRYIVVRPRKS